MSLMDNLGLAARVANLPVGWQAKLLSYAVVGVVCLVIGGLGGYKAGSAIMYQQEDKKLDACKDQVNAAVDATNRKYLDGQASVSDNKASSGEARLESETKRQELLSKSVDPDPQPILIVDPTVSKPDAKAQKSSKVRASIVSSPSSPSLPSDTAGPKPDPACAYSVSRATVGVINQLLEISNETGLYDVPSSDHPASGGLRNSGEADPGDVVGSVEQTYDIPVEGGPEILLTSSDVGGQGVLGG